MHQPAQIAHRRVGIDTDALRAYAPLPGLGILPVNAHVIHARQPVLIDTGMAVLREDFLRELRAVIDPAELRWIWLTHIDADHVGNLAPVLAEAPRAKVVTNYLGLGKLGLQQLPTDRVFLLNPGQTLDVGDRQLLAVQPPCYDAPETMAVFDARTRHLFSADCFGALMAEQAESADDMTLASLREGLFTWSAIDAPWLRLLGAAQLAATVSALRQLSPAAVYSSHLPPAVGMADTLFEMLIAARYANPFVGPDQAALDRMMAFAKAA
jgi:glyoxylase-like metal-dependent hydrolase (beta-lactamase superfamily II)